LHYVEFFAFHCIFIILYNSFFPGHLNCFLIFRTIYALNANLLNSITKCISFCSFEVDLKTVFFVYILILRKCFLKEIYIGKLNPTLTLDLVLFISKYYLDCHLATFIPSSFRLTKWSCCYSICDFHFLCYSAFTE